MLVEVSDGVRINARHVSTLGAVYHNQATQTYIIKVSMVNGDKHELKFRTENDAKAVHAAIVRDNQTP